ncbi:MAG: cytochrome c3 family protein [Candidatus Methanoperedens sp.]
MHQHLKRAFTLLALGIIAFILVRSMIVPDSFGQYGWYRGDSVLEIRNFPVEHAGSVSCGAENCHQTIYSVWINGSHKTINCETCHGPAEQHVSNIRIMPSPANDSRDYCGLCHFKRAARPPDFLQIDPDIHGENLQCTYCHNPHKPGFV